MVIATDKDGVVTCPVCEVAGRGRIECKPLNDGKYWCPMCDEVMLHPVCNSNCDLVISDEVNCKECRASEIEIDAEAFDKEMDSRIMAERGQ